MRLVKCADCGAEISPRAKACPKCGAPPKRQGCAGFVVVIALFVLFVIYAIGKASNGDAPLRAAAPAEAIAEADAAVEMTISDEGARLSRAEVERAISEFRRICQPLGGAMWSDIRAVSAEVFAESASYRLAKGWKTTIMLKLTVPDYPQKIPMTSEQTGVIAGHVLYYFIGGGREPGFFASKRASQYLCGMRVTQVGADEFLRASEFGFLR